MLQVIDIRVRGFSLTHLDLYWRVADTVDPIYLSHFQVLRSEAPEGPYVPICPEFTDGYHFRDDQVDLRSPHTNWYYRIQVRDGLSGEVKTFPEYGGACLAARPSLAALEAARLHRLAFETQEAGRSVWIFPRRTFGQRCTCVNPNTQVREDDNCQTCYTTGYVGGYLRPIRVAADIGPTVRGMRALAARSGQGGTTFMKIADYPRLLPGWVVVEAENQRWRISGAGVQHVEILRYPIFQIAPLESINRGDAEYALPVQLSELEKFEASPPKAFSNPMTLDSLAAEIADMTTSVRGVP